MGFKARSFSDNITGDGIAQAFMVGAELKGTEDPRAGSGWCFENKYRIGGFNMFQGAGLIFTNAKGERFLEKSFPELKNRVGTQHHQLARFKEAYEGRGPIYVDMTHFSQAKVERLRRVLPINMPSVQYWPVGLSGSRS